MLGGTAWWAAGSLPKQEERDREAQGQGHAPTSPTKAPTDIDLGKSQLPQLPQIADGNNIEPNATRSPEKQTISLRFSVVDTSNCSLPGITLTLSHEDPTSTASSNAAAVTAQDGKAILEVPSDWSTATLTVIPKSPDFAPLLQASIPNLTTRANGLMQITLGQILVAGVSVANNLGVETGEFSNVLEITPISELPDGFVRSNAQDYIAFSKYLEGKKLGSPLLFWCQQPSKYDYFPSGNPPNRRNEHCCSDPKTISLMFTGLPVALREISALPLLPPSQFSASNLGRLDLSFSSSEVTIMPDPRFTELTVESEEHVFPVSNNRANLPPGTYQICGEYQEEGRKVKAYSMPFEVKSGENRTISTFRLNGSASVEISWDSDFAAPKSVKVRAVSDDAPISSVNCSGSLSSPLRFPNLEDGDYKVIYSVNGVEHSITLIVRGNTNLRLNSRPER